MSQRTFSEAFKRIYLFRSKTVFFPKPKTQNTMDLTLKERSMVSVLFDVIAVSFGVSSVSSLCFVEDASISLALKLL